MSKQFLVKKRTILESLSVPEGEYTDLSPKGAVDDAIRDLVASINAIDDLVTTSSCSGRFVIYLDGHAKAVPAQGDAGAPTTAAGKGGKGGGTWLFTSHDPIVSPFGWNTVVRAGDGGIGPLTPLDLTNRLVHCKFEPMILHVLAASLDSAKAVLAAAQSAGFRESGISSITQSSTGEVQMAMVAVRTTGLAFDNLVASFTARDVIMPAVDDQHLQKLVLQANIFFAANAQRIERFTAALLEHFRQPVERDWEPPTVRAARKRAEGQAAAAEKRSIVQAAVETVDLNGFGFDGD